MREAYDERVYAATAGVPTFLVGTPPSLGLAADTLELSSTSRVLRGGATILPASNRNFELPEEELSVMVDKIHRVLFYLLLCAAALAVAPVTFGQDSSQSSRAIIREDDTNLDTQLYLILATNRDIEEKKAPASLDPIMKRLSESLSFKHFSLSGTFLNRVRNNGRLDVSWVGGPFTVPTASTTSNPSFSQFTALVKLITEDNREIVRMTDFRFGLRVPIVTGPSWPTPASTAAGVMPIVNYEPIGLRTDISMREGVPVIAGTLHMGPSGDALVVVVSAKRAGTKATNSQPAKLWHATRKPSRTQPARGHPRSHCIKLHRRKWTRRICDY
ncbi:MAG: hypothetical protein DMF72_18865 [Acidobacteria bacterium]|nr:MAG: hypothetical protein DMF72_18865 [Acidobacteriota bacterium]